MTMLLFFLKNIMVIEYAKNVDMAAKRRKKHKNKISGRINSVCYIEQKSEF